MVGQPSTVIVVVGTRPEFIKLAPLLLELRRKGVRSRGFITRQHSTMLQGLDKFFGLSELDYAPQGDPNGDLNSRFREFLGHCSTYLEPFQRSGSIVVVQGDTASALAGALAAFHLGLSVAHVEAGLRSGDKENPYPEEVYRKIISQVADRHYAPTAINKGNLLSEGINESDICVSGNTIVDALNFCLKASMPTRGIELLRSTASRYILFTGHRRENQNFVVEEALRQIQSTLDEHPDLGCIFPAHLSPEIQKIVNSLGITTDRLIVCPPLEYPDFIFVAKHAELIISDSGGIQEEAATLGTPVLVIRKTTERPEAIAAGVAELVPDVRDLRDKINLYLNGSQDNLGSIENPFGDGNAAEKIVGDLLSWKSLN